MLICFICQTQHHSSQQLISHLRGEHSYYPGSKFKLICSQQGCRHQFQTYAGFRKHLNNVHSNVQKIALTSTVGCSSSEPLASSSRVDTLDDQMNPQHESPCSSVSSENNDSELTKDSTKELCESIVAKLQGSGISNSLVTSIVGDLEELTDTLHSQAKHNMLSALPTSDPYKFVINESFEKLENPFTNLNTEWKRNKYFKEKWGVVEPVEITLGMRYDSRLNQKSGTYDQVPVKDTFIYVPILETLEFMCRNPDICDLLRKDCRLETDTFTDFSDGSYFKTHPLFTTKRHALQIQIYYDDFETANPLGSKRVIQKIGCLYFIVRNLPPKFNSVLMNIHLLSLFHTQDISKYGFNVILEPLINDIKILESQGLSLPFSDEQIYGTIAQITGDNLGMHSILGFNESFNSRHFCRLCLIEKQDSQTVYSEDDPKVVLRGREIFEMHCQSLQENPQLRSLYGLKTNSTLNTLKYFHVCNNYSFDIMHDLLEGVAQYEIKLLFGYLTQNFISEEDLLSRIYSFDYGFLERKNRPTKIILESAGNNVGLNSIQTLCLVKNLPLLFGDIVPPSHKHWSLLLLLLQIMNIVFSPCLTLGMTVYLKHLIADHHKLFKYLYPQKNVIPKHHFMIHYSSSIRKIGPLLFMWSMRFEAKHKMFKDIFKNFKNITKSLAKRHQMAIAYHWESFTLKHNEFGSIKSFTLREENVVSNHILEMILSKDAFSTSWVKVDGVEYRAGLVVCSAMENEMPVFCQISDVLLVDNLIYLLVNKTIYREF
ncbi:uncharacterized protein LOC127618717 [Xyrauchen texanus]|uniref:uncharacterized protein LOC127618717 n=1 Tax=Xyrauchen texanus TaxID=154827 RepID=UPI002242A591|nr:uncharacterized protein LOC127618717 [Xyrauchen texanus]XP_051947287.1 uncharacterized protein LOC127618717 [Xyrauchen texanus]